MSELKKALKNWANTENKTGAAEEAAPSFILAPDVPKGEEIGKAEEFVSKTQKIMAAYGNDYPICEMSRKDYINMLSYLSKAMWKIKSSSPVFEGPEKEDFKAKMLKTEDIRVRAPEIGLLEIKTPLLHPNQYAGAYLTAQSIENAIREFIKETPIEYPDDKKMVLVFRRFVNNSAKNIVDNDNYEQRRVTNTIANIFGISDAFDSMFFFYSAKIVEVGDECSMITLLTADEFAENAKIFI